MNDVNIDIVDKDFRIQIDTPEVFTFGSGEDLPPAISIEVVLESGIKVKLVFSDILSFDYLPINSTMVRHKAIIDSLIPLETTTTTLYQILNSEWISELTDKGLIKDKVYRHFVLVLSDFMYQIVSSNSITVSRKINTHFRDI